MAITTIHPIKKTLDKAIAYISDVNKTLNGELITAFGCCEFAIDDDFKMVLNDKRSTNKSVIARHLIQSFKPGEVTIDLAHNIGIELANKLLKDKYQYVIATHIDKEHIHNHIIFNNVSFVDYKCFNSNKKVYREIRNISDELCLEHNLSVIKDIDLKERIINPDKTISKYKKKYRVLIKKDIDLILKSALNYEDFLNKLRLMSYKIKDGKELSLLNTTTGQKRFIRTDTLGSNYSKLMLNYRLDHEFIRLKDWPIISTSLPKDNQMIDMRAERFQTEKGLRYWAIRQNNKSIMTTLSEMKKLGVGSYEQLINYITQIEELQSSEQVDIDKKIHELKKIKEQEYNYRMLDSLSNYERHLKALPKNEQFAFEIEYQDEFKQLSQVKDKLKDGPSRQSLNEEMEKLKSEIFDFTQQKIEEDHLIMQMKILANNFDKFMNRNPRYEENNRKEKQSSHYFNYNEIDR
ncbi:MULTISPECIES: relaxase/mobilization nuclease domain-containing protein [unclassified Aerococcus]|uniref:relaxase/mobilization nuclease domain-containing protein n=4 Tax=Aerococcus TaxID=1375 RepID=UPI0008A5AE2D|nr:MULTISPECIES: relaxase/mobilization nuclease domain-containing protein [unclassified Aerococcus]MDK6679221.1 relaxase/mobilization nuclease domain-containing protein [Aerococcus sp. UMB8608]MDK6685937.1 relaxase/mobilization nuclease domain-containing protein [Aerococcus sp. UMB8623]MDK6939296.1 relaxase/mobilization nuclease domain-containing protein [Aerococcus sp. UMB8487]OFR32560.1 hypothetical protein HMPREF2892_08075 [Aerococcus sp. HMSC061A03]OFT40874.1 hypothetical protein HMPREF316